MQLVSLFQSDVIAHDIAIKIVHELKYIYFYFLNNNIRQVDSLGAFLPGATRTLSMGAQCALRRRFLQCMYVGHVTSLVFDFVWFRLYNCYNIRKTFLNISLAYINSFLN